MKINGISNNQIFTNPHIVHLNADIMTVTRPSKAAFRRFMAEAPAQINLLEANVSRSQPPAVHFSSPSGELKNAFMESIRSAKTSVEMMTFSFSDPELIDLLREKAKEGVKVTVVIDKNHMGSIAPLAQEGLITLLTRNEGEGRIHHKVTVIDEETVWIGSANFSPDALVHQNNTLIHLQNKELAKTLHQEIEFFLGIRQREVNLPSFEIEGQKVELLMFPHVPFGVRNSPEQAVNEAGKRRIIEMIDNAKSSLRFAVCVWTDPDLAAAVIRAKNRGVKVDVIVWRRAESVEIANLFTKHGITVVEKPHLPLMHNKFMLVDNEHFFNGSANWSKSWFSRNDESGIILNHLSEAQKKSLSDYLDDLYLK